MLWASFLTKSEYLGTSFYFVFKMFPNYFFSFQDIDKLIHYRTGAECRFLRSWKQNEISSVTLHRIFEVAVCHLWDQYQPLRRYQRPVFGISSFSWHPCSGLNFTFSNPGRVQRCPSPTNPQGTVSLQKIDGLLFHRIEELLTSLLFC